MTQQPRDPARTLAQRLRDLRKNQWPGLTITQAQLGRALGGAKPASAALISSWENTDKPVIPPVKWLRAYATFFATRRSPGDGSFRLLRQDELTEAERAERDSLLRELLSIREDALRVRSATAQESVIALGGTWHFADGAPVRIVCAEIPPDQRNLEATPTHPTLPYGDLYSFASLDALFELHGHIRAANPHSDVRVIRALEIEPDDLASHLIVLGGVDWNPLARRIPKLLPRFPVRQISDETDPRNAYFEVSSGDEVLKYGPELSQDGELIWDVGLFVRAPNPTNQSRTLTVCNGMYSLGTWAVVRALTDVQFRDRNESYLNSRFSGFDSFSILMQILILNTDEAVTPDWTRAGTRLYEWSENS
jgi:hypothetical protein